jgi:uncharacterized protein YbbC (DUF1343 family)
MIRWLILCFLVVSCSCLSSQIVSPNSIQTGADQTERYLPLLKGKRVAVFANQTSRVGSQHLVDTLLKSGIQVIKIFGPEHGFRGKADAGEIVKNGIDPKTGIPVISLYGKHKKPTAEDLADVDVLVFDIQDVGVRFYTFISSLQYCLEAVIENKKRMLLLDRPNPNGFYVDGPVLDTAFRSFVGMQPVPVVYGMTIGEYASMLVGESWLHISKENKKVYSPNDALTIIPCRNYTHDSLYKLPIAPSPNLREMASVYCYPSTCFFEGTLLSEGRGTDKPFQIFGHPNLPKHLYSFTPNPTEGAKQSKCYGQTCYGWNIHDAETALLKSLQKKIRIDFLLEAYQLFPGKDSFFLKNDFFNQLAGNDVLMKQIKSGKTELEIRKSWQLELQKFKAIRKKYLLYEDFKETD